MKNQLKSIQDTLLMGPGPSCVHPSVYNALATNTIGHLDPYFINLMDQIKGYLKVLMNTDNKLTIPVSGTGSAGMETCFVNLLEKNDNILILINGVFGTRMEDVASRLGANVDVLKFKWGTPVIVDNVEDQLNKKNYDLLAVVHAETSTGVCNPINEIGELIREKKTLYLVDCVTSLGGMEVKMDKWHIDALYSGTQKCLSCPPGLSPVSFSDGAVEKLNNRKAKVPNWYLDLSMITQYWSGKSRVYHHTAPINMLYGLYQACYNIIQEGMEAVFKRHLNMHNLLISELEKIGIQMLVEKQSRLPMLNSLIIPDGVNDGEIRSRLLNEYHIEIGGGLGPLTGKIWRIGLMGETAREENIIRLIDVLKKLL